MSATKENTSSSFFSKTIHALQSFLHGSEISVSSHYSTLRHSAPFVYYAGTDTKVTFSVFGDKALPNDRRIFLQKRGWLTGLFGWTFGSLIGGGMLPGREVTPETSLARVSPSIQKSVKSFHDKCNDARADAHRPLQTNIVHIPVVSGDGYFRLRVTTSDPYDTLSTTRVFRVGSASLSSASPRGADIITLPFESVFKTLQVTSITAGYAAFYSAFPFLKLAQYIPGGWQKSAIDTLWRWANGNDRKDELLEKYQVNQRMESVQNWGDNVDKSLPWSKAGVRRREHFESDKKFGRGGEYYDYR